MAVLQKLEVFNPQSIQIPAIVFIWITTECEHTYIFFFMKLKETFPKCWRHSFNFATTVNGNTLQTESQII